VYTVMNAGSCCKNISPQRGLMYRTSDVATGRDSSVGIANRYGLDGPGIESRLGQDFPHPSRPALRPTQAPIQWLPGLSRG